MNWKDIPEYEGLYQVSDCGQVKSCYRIVKHHKGGGKVLKERILKPSLHTKGYHCVNLCKDGKTRKFFVHRLVALAFLEGDNSLTVNHIDECKTNNHVSNLEYLTRGDNLLSWIKNNPQRLSEIKGQKILDTKTGITFYSIREVSKYMYEKEGAKSDRTWYGRIQRGSQYRFKFVLT